MFNHQTISYTKDFKLVSLNKIQHQIMFYKKESRKFSLIWSIFHHLNPIHTRLSHVIFYQSDKKYPCLVGIEFMKHLAIKVIPWITRAQWGQNRFRHAPSWVFSTHFSTYLAIHLPNLFNFLWNKTFDWIQPPGLHHQTKSHLIRKWTVYWRGWYSRLFHKTIYWG